MADRLTLKTENEAAFVHTAESADSGARLDRFLSGRIETLSRARLQELIRGGHVRAEGLPVLTPNAKVQMGQSFEVRLPPAEPCEAEAETITLHVLYEDAALIVIDKPAGLVVHPGAGNPRGTLVNALIAHCGTSLSGIAGVARPGIVHRLDKDTSGVMVVAKTDEAHRDLAAQFADHGRTGVLRREYRALVWGEPTPKFGRIETQIGRHTASRVKMAVLSRGGRQAITHYESDRTFRVPGSSPGQRGKGNNQHALSVIRCILETGRTHQVRVHMAHIGTPIVGDALYGAGFATKASILPEELAAQVRGLGRQALHAAVLAFRHPVTGKVKEFESTFPEDIANLCNGLERMDAKLSKN